MKLSTHKLLTATASGMFAVCAGIWATAMILDNSVLAIPLLLIAVFFSLVCRIQLHDRRHALTRENWRRQPVGSDDWQFENITGPRL